MPDDLKITWFLFHMLQYYSVESKGNITVTARHELAAISSLVALLALSILVPWIAPRVVLGIPFVLFFPGYTLLSALFPRKTPLDLLERLVISVGFSLVLVTLIGFITNFTPWGLRLIPLFVAFSAFTLAMSFASYYRRRRLPESERFEIVIPLRLPVGSGPGRWARPLSVVLIASMVIAVGSIGFAIAMPKAGEKFTELYVLGPQGRASEYPQTVTMGDTATVRVGVINREQRHIAYRLEVLIGGVPTLARGSISLDNGELWEEAIPLIPARVGKEQKVEINLYRPGDTQPYEFLILWLDVTERGSQPVR